MLKQPLLQWREGGHGLNGQPLDQVKGKAIRQHGCLCEGHRHCSQVPSASAVVVVVVAG